LPGKGHIRKAFADIAGTGRFKLGDNPRTKMVIEQRQELQKSCLASLGHVDHSASDAFSFGGEDITVNDILDEGEVS
jgi:hypothetical protein